MAPDVELDPIEGGEIAVRDGDDERIGTVETIEEEERFAFTWSRPGEGESFVEFTLEPLPGRHPGHCCRDARSARPRWRSPPDGGPRLARLHRSLRFAPVA